MCGVGSFLISIVQLKKDDPIVLPTAVLRARGRILTIVATLWISEKVFCGI